MERETIRLLYQKPLTALEELLLVMGVNKNHISLKGGVNLCLMLAAGTVQRVSEVKQQLKYRLNEYPLSFLRCRVWIVCGLY